MKTLIFCILTVLSVIALVGIILLMAYYVIARIRIKKNPKLIICIRKTAICFTVSMILNVALAIFSQLTVSTPRIVDENGNTPENSIAELRKIELNGREQWISIRGWDKDAPVLLFLAGGPGGTQMAAVRHELAELEKYFVVVNWDQPGSGKSYYAFIGTGQMVDFAETERMDYMKAIEIAQSKGDTTLIEKLKANGEPPYYGKDVTWKSALYLNYLSAYMADNPNIHNPGYNTFRDIFSSEYGLLDKINFFRGIINTYNHVYQQLYEIDLRKGFAKLDVPVYFFLGRYDVNAPTVMVEEYERILDAPDKKIVWFEHSGHSPWINEPEKFVKEMLSCFSEN